MLSVTSKASLPNGLPEGDGDGVLPLRERSPGDGDRVDRRQGGVEQTVLDGEGRP
jgi:hypothetical protein